MAYMPSHQSLVQGGHAHLVPLIEAAGGFLEVCLNAKAVARETQFLDSLHKAATQHSPNGNGLRPQ